MLLLLIRPRAVAPDPDPTIPTFDVILTGWLAVPVVGSLGASVQGRLRLPETGGVS